MQLQEIIPLGDSQEFSAITVTWPNGFRIKNVMISKRMVDFLLNQWDCLPFSPERKPPQDVEKMARFPGGETCVKSCRLWKAQKRSSAYPLVGWGSSTWRGGGQKFGVSVEAQGRRTFGRISQNICWDMQELSGPVLRDTARLSQRYPL